MHPGRGGEGQRDAYELRGYRALGGRLVDPRERVDGNGTEDRPGPGDEAGDIVWPAGRDRDRRGGPHDDDACPNKVLDIDVGAAREDGTVGCGRESDDREGD